MKGFSSRQNGVGNLIYDELCKILQFENPKRQNKQKPKTPRQNNKNKVFYATEINSDHVTDICFYHD